MKNIEFANNAARGRKAEDFRLQDFSMAVAGRVRSFHQSFAEYSATPLHRLSVLAHVLGVRDVFVKDESFRFGLNAFKVLGSSYAVGVTLGDALGVSLQDLSAEYLRSAACKQKLGTMTFATATDGNHGRAVAWTAATLGHKAVVYMPHGSDDHRAQAIRKLGASCEITDLNYDDTVRMVRNLAEQNNWLVVQDTAWEGYEDIPRRIMQGYMTLALEAQEQMEAQANTWPTHIFLQAGVGSFAAAMVGYFASQQDKELPKIIIVEPEAANCYYQSFLQGDGVAHTVGGSLHTLMAGLACGEPSSLSWPVIEQYVQAGLSCHDSVAALGMRVLAAPCKGDPVVVAGESGAAPVGALYAVVQDASHQQLREQLGLDADSVVLAISTEGDTSPQIYRDVVWHGAFPYK